jgi:hypothetical protein
MVKAKRAPLRDRIMPWIAHRLGYEMSISRRSFGGRRYVDIRRKRKGGGTRKTRRRVNRTR